MSYRMKFGWFDLNNILFYDDEERRIFEYKVKSDLGEYLSKVDGKRYVGHGLLKLRSKEDRDNLKYLKMNLDINRENNTARLRGYGHRRIVMPIEMWVNDLFNEGRIVSYNPSDGLIRDWTVPVSEDESFKKFYGECKRRLELYKKGELEPPVYRQQKLSKGGK